MYKSPIEVYANDMLSQIRQREEDQIVAEVSQAVDVNVEKEELIKALNYDRNQYYKGYEDGKRASKWIPVDERLPEDGTWNIWQSKTGAISIERYKEDAYNHFYPSGRFFSLEDAVAWMPLPERYKAEEEEG